MNESSELPIKQLDYFPQNSDSLLELVSNADTPQISKLLLECCRHFTDSPQLQNYLEILLRFLKKQKRQCQHL